MPPRPNLFIVGAPRCGTTSMHQYLAAHPQIFMSPVKEPHRFGSDLKLFGPRYDRYRQDEQAYLGLFEGADGHPVVGEASPGYLGSERAAAELKAFNPDARIMVLLRPPTEAVVSLHNLFLHTGNEDLASLADALDAEQDRRRGERIPATCHSLQGLFYTANMWFSTQVARFFDVFGRDRVLVLLLEDLARRPAPVYRQVLEFLDVDPDVAPAFDVVNASRQVRSRRLQRFMASPPRAVTVAADALGPVGTQIKRLVRKANTAPRRPSATDLVTRRRLDDLYRPMVAELGELLGRDLSHWCPS